MYIGACTFRTIQVARTARLLARTTVSCTYMSSGSDFLSRSSVKVVVDEFLAGDSVWMHLIDITGETRDGNDGISYRGETVESPEEWPRHSTEKSLATNPARPGKNSGRCLFD